MSEQNYDDADISTEQEEADLDTANGESNVHGDEGSVEEIKAQRDKATELANNYKIRAEKAERLAKEGKGEKQAPTAGDMSQNDMFAILKADVHEDDVERVQRFAKSEGLSVKDALKSDELKAILALKAEQRKSASASNVGATKRGTGKVTAESLLEKAQKGEMPESDEDMKRLVLARLGIKE